MIVSDEEIEEHQMERQLITGIAHDKNEAKIIVTRVPDKPGAVANIFGPLAASGINVDMIIQNVGREKGETDVTFTVPATDLLRSIDLLEAARSEEHTSELQSLMRISYAVFCLKKKTYKKTVQHTN